MAIKKKKTAKTKKTKGTSSAKTKFTAYIAASIDGRIAESARSGTDWTSPEDWEFFQASLRRADAVIAGHNTFKVAESKLRKRNTIVLTSKVKLPKEEGSVVFINPKNSKDPEDHSIKSFLRSKKYRNVAVVGGARVYDFCLRNGMLDELYVTVEPYVFTGGVPMFSGAEFKKHRFTLISAKKLNKKGTILLRYKYAG